MEERTERKVHPDWLKSLITGGRAEAAAAAADDAKLDDDCVKDAERRCLVGEVGEGGCCCGAAFGLFSESVAFGLLSELVVFGLFSEPVASFGLLSESVAIYPGPNAKSPLTQHHPLSSLRMLPMQSYAPSFTQSNEFSELLQVRILLCASRGKNSLL